MRARHLLVLAIALPACALVSDLDFAPGGGAAGSGAGGAGVGAGGGDEPATTTSAATTSLATTTSSTGGGGMGAGGDAGGGGGGSTPGCSDGPDGGAPWSLLLRGARGQHEGVFSEIPPTSIAMDGDRLVMTVIVGAGAGQVTLGDQLVHTGPAGVVLLVVVDDGGTVEGVWPIGEVVESAIPGTSTQVVVPRPGVALVAVSSTVETIDLLRVDLCTGVAEIVASCAGSIQGAALGTDGAARTALAFEALYTPTCALPAGCPPPPSGSTAWDTFVWAWDDADGTCATVRIADPTETPTSYSRQQVHDLAFQGEHLIASGIYQGRWDEAAATATAGAVFDEPVRLVAGPYENRTMLARLEPQGTVLTPIAAHDLGAPGFGTLVLHVDDDEVRLVGGSRDSARGPFADGLTEPPPSAESDVTRVAIDVGGARRYVRRESTPGWDGAFGSHPGADGLGLAGILSGSSPSYGACGDPFFFETWDDDGPIPGTEGGGCAFFGRVGVNGEVEAPLVLDAAEDGALDLGLASIGLPGGDRLVVGATTGTHAALGIEEAADDLFSTLYVARVR